MYLWQCQQLPVYATIRFALLVSQLMTKKLRTSYTGMARTLIASNLLGALSHSLKETMQLDMNNGSVLCPVRNRNCVVPEN